MDNGLFKLVSGRDVELMRFHIQVSTIGYLAGAPEYIRAEVLRELPSEIRERCGKTGVLLQEPPPSPRGGLPAYTFWAELTSKPIHPDANVSTLVVCWFGNSLPENVYSFIAAQLETVDWDKHAEDGHF